MKTDYTSIEQYIRSFPAPTRRLLKDLRAVIREAAPDAREKISYGMPSFSQNGNLVGFAAYENHIGFYGASSAHRALASKVAKYKTGKGTLRFPLDQPIPAKLVRQIVKLAVERNSAKSMKVLRHS
jgi:uncharacterized protein YdhG (YjbR/CyaY superfamily)